MRRSYKNVNSEIKTIDWSLVLWHLNVQYWDMGNNVKIHDQKMKLKLTSHTAYRFDIDVGKQSNSRDLKW